jgi:hypothetical protein
MKKETNINEHKKKKRRIGANMVKLKNKFLSFIFIFEGQ